MDREKSMARFNEDIEDVKIAGQCEFCKLEVYIGELCYSTPNGLVHHDCIKDYAIKEIDANEVYAGEDL